MVKKRSNTQPKQHDRDIHLEELGPSSRQHYDRNPHPAVGPQSSLPDTGLRRRASARAEPWESELVDQLPSRQFTGTIRLNKTLRAKRKTQRPGFGTIRLPPHGLDSLDTEDIVGELLKDQDFVDGPEELQTEEIKALHTNLARKLSIQAKIREKAEKSKHRHITWSKQVKYSISLLWKRFKDDLAEVSYSVDLWRGDLKKIEGKFGSGVASYFSFLKWLILLNIPVFIVLFSFITIPQLLYRSMQDPSYNHTEPFRGIEILTGEGWFRESELYYGTHTDGNIMRISSIAYNMPQAYLLTIGAYYLITVLALLFSLTKSYKRNFIDSTNVIKFQSVTKVLIGWDYAITSKDAANLKQESIHKELQEYMSVFRQSAVKRDRCQKCGVVMLRIFINVLILGLIGGAGYLIRYVSESLTVESTDLGVEQLALPAVISAVIFILPLAFSILGDFENYENPGVTLYLTMTRTILLFVVSLGVIIQFWFANVRCPDKGDINGTLTALDQENCSPCWENFLGYNMYRLVVVDFLVTLLITFFTEFLRRLIAQCCIKALGYPEFNIGRNTLYLIYSQSLIWIAAFYSPLLPFIVIIKLLVLFYVKRYSVIHNCRPSVKPWRGGQAHTVIMAFLGLALILCFIAVGYSIVRLKPSASCGPYRGKETAYTVIQELFDAWAAKEKTFSGILSFVTSTGFLAGVILGLLIAAYYARIRATGLDESVLALKEQIALEGKDKKFLIKLIQSAGPRPPAARRGPHTRNPNYSNLATAPGSGVEDTEDTLLVDYDSADEQHGGGKTFAKTTMAAAINNTHYDAPGAPKARPPQGARGSGDGPPGAPQGPFPPAQSAYLPATSYEPQPQDAYNEGFVDKSWDPEDAGRSPSMNPAYDDRSLTNRPNLPYPGRHYDMYKPGT